MLNERQQRDFLSRIEEALGAASAIATRTDLTRAKLMIAVDETS